MELKVVSHCFMYKDSSIIDYLAFCQNKNFFNVSFLQRNYLNEWLGGLLETSQLFRIH